MKIINEKGSSMIEVIGVLAFLSTLAVGAYSLIASARSKIQITREHQQTKDIIKAMREQFSAFRPPNTTSATLYKLGIFDNVEMDESGNPKENGESSNLMGHKMEITMPATGFAEQNPTFKLTYYDVDFKTCVNLLTADWGSDPSSGLVEISTGGTTFQWPKDYTSGHHPLPPDITTASTECSRAQTVNVSWEYYF